MREMEEEERESGEEERKDWGKLMGNGQAGTLIGPEHGTRQASQSEGEDRGWASQVDFAVYGQSEPAVGCDL